MKLKWRIIKNENGNIIERAPDKNGIYIENEELFEYPLDEYGNEQLIEKNGCLAIKRKAPTAEQIARRKKQLFKQHYAYDRDDEIALIKDAINALQVGKEIPMDYTQMELDRAAAKREADDEIEADLRKIQEQEDPTKREA